MDIWNYLKNIYSGRENLLTHIILFSLCGILAVVFSKFSASYLGIFYLGYPLTSGLMTYVCSFLMIIISMFMFGYIYSYSNALFKDPKSKLPDVNSEVYVAFFKMLPIVLFWFLIIIMLIFLGLSIFSLQSEPIKSFVYNFLLLFLFPYINVIFVLYSKDFNLKPALYKPLNFIKIIRKIGFPITVLVFKCIILLYVIVEIVLKLLSLSSNITDINTCIGIRILILSMAFYLISVLNYIYVSGVVKSTEDIDV